MAENETPTHLDAQDARAGSTPHMTRYVLGFGLVLVIIAFVVIVYLR
jgi:heme/copper-type cytochrome/quinol oxidase subunit 4